MCCLCPGGILKHPPHYFYRLFSPHSQLYWYLSNELTFCILVQIIFFTKDSLFAQNYLLIYKLAFFGHPTCNNLNMLITSCHIWVFFCLSMYVLIILHSLLWRDVHIHGLYTHPMRDRAICFFFLALSR